MSRSCLAIECFEALYWFIMDRSIIKHTAIQQQACLIIEYQFSASIFHYYQVNRIRVYTYIGWQEFIYSTGALIHALCSYHCTLLSRNHQNTFDKWLVFCPLSCLKTWTSNVDINESWITHQINSLTLSVSSSMHWVW
jgi:hypothetical protein